MLEMQAPITVTVNLLRQRGSGALQIHLVNFDVAGNPQVDHIEISLRLPPGVSARQVRVFSPDSNEVLPIEGTMQEGNAGIPVAVSRSLQFGGDE